MFCFHSLVMGVGGGVGAVQHAQKCATLLFRPPSPSSTGGRRYSSQVDIVGCGTSHALIFLLRVTGDAHGFSNLDKTHGEHVTTLGRRTLVGTIVTGKMMLYTVSETQL